MGRTALLILTASFAAVAAAYADDGVATGADLAASGRLLFEQKCTACHTIGAGIRVGPDLSGVTERRSEDSLMASTLTPSSFP